MTILETFWDLWQLEKIHRLCSLRYIEMIKKKVCYEWIKYMQILLYLYIGIG